MKREKQPHRHIIRTGVNRSGRSNDEVMLGTRRKYSKQQGGLKFFGIRNQTLRQRGALTPDQSREKVRSRALKRGNIRSINTTLTLLSCRGAERNGQGRV